MKGIMGQKNNIVVHEMYGQMCTLYLIPMIFQSATLFDQEEGKLLRNIVELRNIVLTCQNLYRHYTCIITIHSRTHHTDVLLGDCHRLSQVLSEWSEKTSIASIQFVIQPNPIDPHDTDCARSGLLRVYHQLYGDYESYLSFIVTPSTEASQLLEQAVTQLSPGEDLGDFQLMLKTGTRGIYTSHLHYIYNPNHKYLDIFSCI